MWLSNIKSPMFIGGLLLIISCSFCHAQQPDPPQRLRRSESFFGLHFDFHAGKEDQEVGKTLTEGMIDSMLLAVKPDYIQVDCKGHPGISSYPTEIGTPVRSFAKDPLRLFREVTAKRGVALYVHYSGVIDEQVAQKHPEWASQDTAGNPNSRGGLSVYSPYADKVLIPQLKELSKKYGIDGAWVDGDCWGVQPDYSQYMTVPFLKESGLEKVPASPDDPHFREFLEFNRQGFLDYLARYVDAIHAFDPDFQITSNWSYSSFMPETVNTDVDFLSGDLTPSNAVYRAAFEARCIAPQGKPWDLMAWSFAWGRELGNSTKTAVQLQQEAAQVLAMGGGFQVYFKQNRDASIQPWTVPVMKDVAAFCRERQTFTHKATPVPQLALLYSNAAYKHVSHHVYSPWSGELDPMSGILYALLDGQQSVEILRENHLHGHMDAYPLIVIPEWEYLEPDFRDELVQYVDHGGRLLVIGAKAVHNFKKELGVDFTASLTDQVRQLEYDHHLAGLRTWYQPAKPKGNTRAFAALDTLMDARFKDEAIIASIASYGEGKIAGVYADLGKVYLNRKTPTYRDFLKGLIAALFPDPLVEVQGTHLLHITVHEKDNKLMVNLINTAGPHANEKVYVYDEIPPVGPFTMTIQSAQKPGKIMLQPENKALDFSYDQGKIQVEVPQLKIHSILVVE